VGRNFGITRERIRQVQNAALVKMRKELKKVEKNVSGSPNAMKVVSQAESIIALLRAE